MFVFLRRLALAIPIVIVALAVTIVAVAELRWDRTFDAPFPNLSASTDSAVIARGQYVVSGPGHCADCHAAQDATIPVGDAAMVPLIGGRALPVPGGMAYTPNITNDSATGIGRISDAQLARALRYGVRHDGRVLLPYMEFQPLSDDDIVAVLSYLRTAPAIRHEVPPHNYSLVTRALLAWLIAPETPSSAPPKNAPTAIGAARGEYVINAVAHCASCHTKRDKVGKYVGPRLAGGNVMASSIDPSTQFVTPNLTPDRATGRIATWSAEQFARRMRGGRSVPGSPMPWEAYSRMSNDDLQSIYAYLHSIPAVANQTGDSVAPVHVATTAQANRYTYHSYFN